MKKDSLTTEYLKTSDGRTFLLHRKDSAKNRRAFQLSDLSIPEIEGPDIMRKTPLEIPLSEEIMAVNTAFPSWKEFLEEEHLYSMIKKQNLRLHLVGLGDVGGTLLTGLRLKSGHKIHTIGIYDQDEKKLQRYEQEINQIHCYDEPMPTVEILSEETIFDCDVFIFAVAVSVPSIAEGKNVDVRMIQLEKNKAIISHYARFARKKGFKGLFAVLSDPVDQLCQAAYIASNQTGEGVWDGCGLGTDQIRGFGLGVMNARASYYADKLYPALNYTENGRAFGPHGKGLIIADDIFNYNESRSEELTKLTETANLRIRELGYKPYIAPALSSGCMSILRCICGEWHYSSTFMGGVFFGCRNRMTFSGDQIEQFNFPPALFAKIKKTYEYLSS